jgi:hypothetical protein
MQLPLRRIGSEQIVETRLEIRVAVDRDALRGPAHEKIAAKPWAIDQLFSSAPDRLQSAKPFGKRGGQIFGCGLLILGGLRKKKARLEVGEPGGHDEIVGGKLKPDLASSFDKFEILFSQMQNGNLRQINLLTAGEFEQQVERAFETVHVNKKRRLRVSFVNRCLKGQFGQNESLHTRQRTLTERGE